MHDPSPSSAVVNESTRKNEQTRRWKCSIRGKEWTTREIVFLSLLIASVVLDLLLLLLFNKLRCNHVQQDMAMANRSKLLPEVSLSF